MDLHKYIAETEKNMDIQNLREQVDCLLSMKKADEAEKLLTENAETAKSDLLSPHPYRQKIIPYLSG